MKVYVSAASAEIGRAEDFIALVQSEGHEVTHDWTRQVRAFQRGDLVDEEQCARDDLNAIMPADAMVLLVPDDPLCSRGIWVELGYAVAFEVPVLAVGQPADASIWRFLVSWVDTESEALEFLETKAAGG